MVLFLSSVAFKSIAVVNAFPTKSSLWKYFYKVLYLMKTSEQRRCKSITGGRIYLFIITKAILINISFYLSEIVLFLFLLICKSPVAAAGMNVWKI